MALVPSIQITLDGRPLPEEQARVLQSLEVENGVHQQGMFKLRIGIGQDQGGDWAPGAETTFTPAKRVGIEVKIGERRCRLINGLLTDFKMNFQSDPCQSQLELTGMDVLEKLKRTTSAAAHAGTPLKTIVSQLFQKHDIDAPSDVPNTGTPNQNRETIMQAHNDLEFLRMLGDRANCEVYVEPSGDRNQGFFEPLGLKPTRLPTGLGINQGVFTPVRNASFYYDLSGPTVVQARMVDAKGKASDVVKSDLRDKVGSRDKTLLGPSDFAKVEDLARHGRETRDDLQRLCDTALEKHSWVVVGKGELDSAAYGDALVPRRWLEVSGVSKAFDGPYLVWKVTHAFTRDLYCQRFELRRKLAVK